METIDIVVGIIGIIVLIIGLERVISAAAKMMRDIFENRRMTKKQLEKCLGEIGARLNCLEGFVDVQHGKNIDERIDELGGCVIDDARAVKKLDSDLHGHIISIMGQIEEIKKASNKAKKGGGCK